MSSKKGYSLGQVDDTDGGVAVEIPDSGITVPYPTPTEEYCGESPDTAENMEVESTTKTKVSNGEFVEMWLDCDSYRVMSTNTGMTISAVQARATRLRKAGVQLPSFTRATRKTKEIDVVDLNNMIKNNQKVITTGG